MRQLLRRRRIRCRLIGKRSKSTYARRPPAPFRIMMGGAAPRTRSPAAARTDAMDVQGVEDGHMAKVDPEIADDVPWADEVTPYDEDHFITQGLDSEPIDRQCAGFRKRLPVLQLVNARYERGAMILSSNRGFDEWGEVSPQHASTATLPRRRHSDRGHQLIQGYLAEMATRLDAPQLLYQRGPQVLDQACVVTCGPRWRIGMPLKWLGQGQAPAVQSRGEIEETSMVGSGWRSPSERRGRFTAGPFCFSCPCR